MDRIAMKELGAWNNSCRRESLIIGIFFEGFIANELTVKELKLFYWRGKNIHRT